MKRAVNGWYVFWVYAGLALATIIAFEPIRHNGFVNYDDENYVSENRNVKAGLTCDGIAWAFTTGHTGYWHPLTWISLMLD